MTYDIEGTIHSIAATQQITDSFKKREIILLVNDGKYDQYIVIEFMQDSVTKLDPYKAGQEVKVSFNMRGRIYGNKCFNTLAGWKIEASNPQPMPSKPVKVEQPEVKINDGSGDDLPF